MSNSYNLIEEGWIPCLMADGSARELGIRETLCDAHKISGLAPELPMEKVAIVRVLLAILHRNFGPKDTKAWRALREEGQFDAQALDSYFEQWYARFDLFDQDHPFYQTRAITAELRSLIGYSFHMATYHFAGGNNATLFDHHTINDDIPLTFAKAARLTVNAQSFGFGFLTYKDGPSARGVNFILLGDNLFQTLMMNLVRYDEENPFFITGDDLPAWEREDAFNPDRKKPNGYLDYLTWQSRKILLRADEDSGIVRELQVDIGLKLDVASEPYFNNPMMQYSKVNNPEEGKPPTQPLKFFEGKALWRDSTALMEIQGEEKKAPLIVKWMAECSMGIHQFRFDSIGISSDQGKVNFYLEELFTFPSVYLERESLVGHLKDCLKKAEEVKSKLWGATNQLAEIFLSPQSDQPGGRKADRADKEQVLTHLNAEGDYWAALEIPFNQLLNDLPENEEEAVSQWHQDLRRSARRAFEKAGEFLGTSPEALKARALGGRALGGGLKKSFED